MERGRKAALQVVATELKKKQKKNVAFENFGTSNNNWLAQWKLFPGWNATTWPAHTPLPLLTWRNTSLTPFPPFKRSRTLWTASYLIFSCWKSFLILVVILTCAGVCLMQVYALWFGSIRQGDITATSLRFPSNCWPSLSLYHSNKWISSGKWKMGCRHEIIKRWRVD